MWSSKKKVWLHQTIKQISIIYSHILDGHKHKLIYMLALSKGVFLGLLPRSPVRRKHLVTENVLSILDISNNFFQTLTNWPLSASPSFIFSAMTLVVIRVDPVKFKHLDRIAYQSLQLPYFGASFQVQPS